MYGIRYTFSELDTVNIDWWICVNVCLVSQDTREPGSQSMVRSIFKLKISKFWFLVKRILT